MSGKRSSGEKLLTEENKQDAFGKECKTNRPKSYEVPLCALESQSINTESLLLTKFLIYQFARVDTYTYSTYIYKL